MAPRGAVTWELPRAEPERLSAFEFRRRKTQHFRVEPEAHKVERAEVTLRIVLQQPPPGVDFGLQKGRGRVYETVQKERSKGEDLAFDFAVTVKTSKDGAPDFAGPFVQGPSGERFVYLDIRT